MDLHVIEKDMPEQVAIALFRSDHLLNVQHGSYFKAYQPSHEAFEAFSVNDLTVFNNFQLEDGQQFTTRELILWKNFVQQKQQKFELRTYKPMSADLIETTYRQAVTRPKYGHTIFVLIAGSITDTDYSSCQSFVSASRAGGLTKPILCRQKSWANGTEAFDTKSLTVHHFR